MDATPLSGFRRQLCIVVNVLGVVAITRLVVLLFQASLFPITIFRGLEICVAAHYRFCILNKKNDSKHVDDKNDVFCVWQDRCLEELEVGKGQSMKGRTKDTVGVVVGWREDENLFSESLQSISRAACISAVVVGIDGNGEEDAPMRRKFKDAFPAAPTPVHIPCPVGEYLEDESNEEANIDVILDRMESFLVQQVGLAALLSCPAICVYQPHRSKKSILFTAFLVSLVLGRLGRGEFIWSSDSDSIAKCGAIEAAIAQIRHRPEAGGLAGHLRNRNNCGSPMSKIIAAKYWFDQEVTRSQTAITGDAECQPGPCTVTRMSALRQVVVAWHNQRFMGRRVVTNEDRHLTTRLLRQEWKVYYIPEAIAETDSPKTLLGWIRQQNRWSRGTHIERFSQSMTYLIKHPWFTVHVWREQIMPFVTMFFIGQFVWAGNISMSVSVADYPASILLELAYVLIVGSDRPTLENLIWTLPAQLFYSTIKPAIHAWGLLTMFDSGWTSHGDGGSFRRRLYEVAPCMIWFNVVAAGWGRAVVQGFRYSTDDCVPVRALAVLMLVCCLPVWIYACFSDLCFRRERRRERV